MMSGRKDIEFFSSSWFGRSTSAELLMIIMWFWWSKPLISDPPARVFSLVPSFMPWKSFLVAPLPRSALLPLFHGMIWVSLLTFGEFSLSVLISGPSFDILWLSIRMCCFSFLPDRLDPPDSLETFDDCLLNSTTGCLNFWWPLTSYFIDPARNSIIFGVSSSGINSALRSFTLIYSSM